MVKWLVDDGQLVYNVHYCLDGDQRNNTNYFILNFITKGDCVYCVNPHVSYLQLNMLISYESLILYIRVWVVERSSDQGRFASDQM